MKRIQIRFISLISEKIFVAKRAHPNPDEFRIIFLNTNFINGTGQRDGAKPFVKRGVEVRI